MGRWQWQSGRAHHKPMNWAKGSNVIISPQLRVAHQSCIFQLQIAPSARAVSSQAVMGFLDRLAGRNAEQREAEEPAQPSAELLSDSGSSSASLGGALSSAVPDYSPAQSPASDGQQSSRLYNPYQVGSSRPRIQ